MGVMSRVLVNRFLMLLLLAGTGLGFSIAYANAPSIDVLTANALLPSEAPGLLAPIAESGRIGWACHPEKAAESRSASNADLPSATLPTTTQR